MQEELGIILRVAPFGERDRLVHFLTEHQGKIAGIAKGAIHSRRFGGSLDLFNCVRLRFVEKSGRDLVRIDEANIRKDFPGIRTSLERLTAAGYFADLAFRLTEERQPAREIFVLLAHYFYLLDQHDVTAEVVRSFEIKLLDRLGYSPVLHQCAQCSTSILEQNPLPASFAVSVERGGVLCRDCEGADHARHLSRDTLIWVNLVRNTPVQEIVKLRFPFQVTAQGADYCKAFLQYHCPGLDRYGFRSHALLEEFLKEAPAAQAQSPQGNSDSAQETAASRLSTV